MTTKIYLIKRGGYLYRPNFRGYTAYKFDAGRYTKEEAESEMSNDPNITIHLTDDYPSDYVSEHIESLEARIKELEEALRWYVQEDETNEGDYITEYGSTWNDMNAYWIEGKHRAMKLLGMEIDHD